MGNGKILSIDELLKRVAFWRTLGERIVFTNGCFDILHAGHIHLLQQCQAAGDRLIVGLNSDASVKRLKGSSRPINNEKDRALLLSALEITDAIVWFEEDTPLRLIEAIKPDVLAKGGDWPKEKIVGASLVESYGGKVLSIPFLDGYSTTSVIERLSK